MKKLIILDVVALTKKHLSPELLPNISKIFENGFVSSMITSFPAVTCSVQASMTSGYYPSEHGIISNGFYDRETKNVSFWEQYASLVEKPRVWDILKQKNSNLKTAVLFFQNTLYIDSDIVITPKPIHHDNKVEMWCYSKPVGFYEELVQSIGEFDLSSYWGPFASLKSSKWIMDATKLTIKKHIPDLMFVYLPHLDYTGQKYGPQSKEFEKSLVELDNIIGELLEFLESNNLQDNYDIMILSEYSFENVEKSISPNVILRDEGLLAVREIGGKEYLDYEHSKAFAMVDHQIAHVFTKKGIEDKVKAIFKKQNGIPEILDSESKKLMNISHQKSGELILCAEKNSWFNYYWWKDTKYAPDFTFNVDIHRKPGYDPLELFLVPNTRTISQDTSLIKGSHGLVNKKDFSDLPLFGMSIKPNDNIQSVNVTQVVPTIAKFFNINFNFRTKSVI